jgi:two-component system, cell cycle sensor histidine kinase PleC
MARVHAGNANLRVLGVRGADCSFRRTAYQRLLDSEPLLRRAVPFLIVFFLFAFSVGAVVLIMENRSEAIAHARKELSLLTQLTGEKFSRDLQGDVTPERIQSALMRAAPPASGAEYYFFVSSRDGALLAATERPLSGLGPQLTAISTASQEFAFENGMKAIAVTIELAEGRSLTAVQPLERALNRWRSDSAIIVTLAATAGFVLLILGFAFHWQAARAREADAIFEMVRARIDTALNRGRCGLWDWDLARGQIYWSDSMFEIVGFPPREELLSFGEVDALVHPDDGSLYDVAKHFAEDVNGTIDQAFRMRHANGEWVWLRARAELVEVDGGARHIVGTVVDINEEKRLAQRTATADMRLRAAVDTISEAFVLWDADDRLVLCNSKFQRLHQLPEAATEPGTPYHDVMGAGRQLLARTPLKSDEEDSRSFEARTGDGHWLKISERRTSDGGFVSVGTDITALKRHEEKLLDSEKQKLATIADLRRSQQKLEFQAQQLAELAQKSDEANRAKSEFLASMSHELRTPLNAIIGFSEIMESGMFGELGAEKYHEYCRDIRDSGRYLLDVINDILDMSKIEAGRLRLDVESLQIDSIVAEAMRVMSVRANEKHICVDADLTAGMTLRADRRAIKQILLNLLSNAIKFTEEGGQVRVHGWTSRSHLMLVIEDSGIGISKAALRRLGRPFEQVESQFTKTYAGSGLGLAIAKSLTELHCGKMKIRSVENVGTKVFVWLPLAGPPREQAEEAA